jgi:hypothetical protein
MKYTGALQKMPIIPYYDAPDGYPRYWIYMSSFGVTRNGVPVTLSAAVYEQAVFLDSGGTLSYLPANIVAALITHFPEAVQSGNVWIVPCSLRDEASTLDFGFGSTIIRVPFHEAIWAASSTTCVIGVGQTTGVNWVLGDTMLRGAYGKSFVVHLILFLLLTSFSQWSMTKTTTIYTLLQPQIVERMSYPLALVSMLFLRLLGHARHHRQPLHQLRLHAARVRAAK